MPQELQTPVIYSQNIKTKGQTYFFDIKAAKNGNKYLSICQSWLRDGQGHRSTLTVFKNDLDQFSQAVAELQEKVKSIE
jgi:hypothetical protein